MTSSSDDDDDISIGTKMEQNRSDFLGSTVSEMIVSLAQMSQNWNLLVSVAVLVSVCHLESVLVSHLVSVLVYHLVSVLVYHLVSVSVYHLVSVSALGFNQPVLLDALRYLRAPPLIWHHLPSLQVSLKMSTFCLTVFFLLTRISSQWLSLHLGKFP